MKRTENVCEYLKFLRNGSCLRCDAIDLGAETVCPKSRSKYMITTACWRIRK